MKRSELIAALQALHDVDREVSERELMELAFAGSRALQEWNNRRQLVLDVLRAKRQAGFRPDSVFFRDVWPVVLKDAWRYRWLRDHCKDVDIREGLGWMGQDVGIDAAIDAEIARGKDAK